MDAELDVCGAVLGEPGRARSSNESCGFPQTMTDTQQLCPLDQLLTLQHLFLLLEPFKISSRVARLLGPKLCTQLSGTDKIISTHKNPKQFRMAPTLPHLYSATVQFPRSKLPVSH